MLDKVLRERVIHNFLFYVIALFFVSFLSWAYIAEIDQVVRAEALVEPVGKVQQLQSRYGGSVVQMDVSVGDVVRENQVLIMLDTQEAQSTFDFTNQKIALLNTELSIYTPLVEAGIEPEITLVQIEQRLLDAKDQLNRAALQLQFSQILSPISGVITAVNLTGVGAV